MTVRGAETASELEVPIITPDFISMVCINTIHSVLILRLWSCFLVNMKMKASKVFTSYFTIFS